MIKIGNLTISYRGMEFALIVLFFQFLYVMDYTPPYQLLAFMIIAMQGFAMFTKEGRLNIKITSYIIQQFVFIVYITAHTILLSQYPLTSQGAVKTVIWNFAIFFMIVNYFCELDELKKLIKCLIVCIVLADIFIILYTGGTGEEGRMAHGVHRPIWYDAVTYVSMEFSNISVYGTLFCLYNFYDAKIKDYKKLIPIPLFILVIILSGSRKSLVFWAVSVFVFVMWSQKKGSLAKQIKLVIISVIILIIGAILIMKVPALYNLIGYRFEGYITGVTTGEYTESSANTRNTMKETAIALFRQNPILGYGLDTFKKFPGSFGTWSHHNYLELLVSCGITSMIVYYWYHIYILIKLWKYRNDDLIAKLFFIQVICICVFDFITVTYMSRSDQTWLALSAYVVWELRKKRQVAKENQIKGIE